MSVISCENANKQKAKYEKGKISVTGELTATLHVFSCNSRFFDSCNFFDEKQITRKKRIRVIVFLYQKIVRVISMKFHYTIGFHFSCN